MHNELFCVISFFISEQATETLSGVYQSEICDTYIYVYVCIWTHVKRNSSMCAY